MIRGIGGVPGAGKTYFTMHCIERELVHSKRWLVTTVEEIELPEFQSYLSRKYPREGIELSQRLQIIPKIEARNWYRYRGHYTLPEFEPKGKTELPEVFDKRCQEYFAGVNDRDAGGVCYFLDEAHRWAKSEEWQTYAGIALFYLSQHRHLNDTFWWVSQNPEQVIATLRRLTQDFHLLRNHYVESFSYFQKPGCFYRESFGYVPDKGRRTSDPYDTGRMSLDKDGLGKCYRTRGALGGEVKVAEDKPPSRKLPFWTVWVAAGLVLAAVVGVLWGAPKLAGMGMAAMFKSGESAMKSSLGLKSTDGSVAAAKASGPVGSQNLTSTAEGSDRSSLPPGRKEDRRVRGVLVRGNEFVVTLTDGTILTERDRAVQRIDNRGVRLLTGETLRMVTPESKPQGWSANRATSLPVPIASAGSSGAAIAGPERERATPVSLESPVVASESPRAVPASSPRPFNSGLGARSPQRRLHQKD